MYECHELQVSVRVGNLYTFDAGSPSRGWSMIHPAGDMTIPAAIYVSLELHACELIAAFLFLPMRDPR
jgi:hypothetical protein